MPVGSPPSTVGQSLISRRRHVNEALLPQFHLHPLFLPHPTGASNDKASSVNHNLPATAAASISGQATASSRVAVAVGVESSSGCWKLTTLQGPMAAEAWLDQHTTECEDMAQPSSSTDAKSESKNQEPESEESGTPAPRRRRRRLNLPEIVFPHALVRLELIKKKSNDVQVENNDKERMVLEWSALPPLHEWAAAHANLTFPPTESTITGEEVVATAVQESRGVSILKSVDAQLWHTKGKDRAATTKTESSMVAAAASSLPMDFHYDWTFSTPFSLSSIASTVATNNRQAEWIPLSKSGMDWKLLADRTQPILYFDEIVLWEDDLHDNGDSNYSMKVRVMPYGVFILSRLVVRVDMVLIRVRETRVLVMTKDNDDVEVYRDVTWREAKWDDLQRKYHLPADVREWRKEATAPMLQSKLPSIPLPPDIMPHSKLSISRK